jgi:hypothetical protein
MIKWVNNHNVMKGTLPMRTRKCILLTISGLIFSVPGGCERKGTSEISAGSEFLRNLRFADLAAKAGEATWEILEDKIYEKFPPLGRSPHVGRRIVAQVSSSSSERQHFVARFQGAVKDALRGHGAMVKGEISLHKSGTAIKEGVNGSSLLDLPRTYYSIEDIHGVADIWCIADSGGITVIVSLIEVW